MKSIFGEIPLTEQNPLLATAPDFHRYCQARVRNCPHFQSEFADWSLEAARRDLLRPAFVDGNNRYYATFQVWQVYHLMHAGVGLDVERAADFDEFETLLRLLVRIQDYYLPQIRSDQRIGELRDYNGDLAIGGTHFCTKTSYVASALADERKASIAASHFCPSAVLKKSGLTAADIRNWICNLVSLAERIDPLSEWYILVRFISYSKRQKLKFESKFAQDLLEMAEMLRLFHSDASDVPIFADILAYNQTGESLLVKRYGPSLSHPVEMLEYIVNEFGLNPAPRAIVLTEGEEWKALHRLYKSVGADPAFVGIDIRSIQGDGNFSLSKWQRFIEYMHEKQVLVYFVVDREGQVESEAKRLLEKPRLSTGKGLLRIVPSKDRICIWNRSFEETNFTDDEIVHALHLQHVSATALDVASLRNGKKGLISALGEKLSVAINKPRLCEDLVEGLIQWRSENRDAKKRPVEIFIHESAQLIVLNHLPTDPELRAENRKTGLLG